MTTASNQVSAVSDQDTTSPKHDTSALGDRPHTVHIAPSPPDARWDPSCLPTDEADDEPRWTELQVASRNGDLGRVEEILAQYDDPSSRARVVNAPPSGWYGQTALQAACLHEHQEVVRVLLAAGADISAPGGNNIYRNAFELACGTGNLGLVRTLLDAGATKCVNPVRVTRYQGRTPVQAAAEGGHSDVVEVLLELGANINSPASPSSGVTALQTACYRGHTDLVKMLIARGADVNGQPGKHSGYTALQGACLVGETDIVELLLQNGADINAPGSNTHGGTALHAAAAGGHLDLVNRLLDAGADPNALAGSRGQTAVQTAFVIGRTDIVDALAAAGATGSFTGGRILFGNTRIRSWSTSEMHIVQERN